jgi:hypothetical protein
MNNMANFDDVDVPNKKQERKPFAPLQSLRYILGEGKRDVHRQEVIWFVRD